MNSFVLLRGLVPNLLFSSPPSFLDRPSRGRSAALCRRLNMIRTVLEATDSHSRIFHLCKNVVVFSSVAIRPTEAEVDGLELEEAERTLPTGKVHHYTLLANKTLSVRWIKRYQVHV